MRLCKNRLGQLLLIVVFLDSNSGSVLDPDGGYHISTGLDGEIVLNTTTLLGTIEEALPELVINWVSSDTTENPTTEGDPISTTEFGVSTPTEDKTSAPTEDDATIQTTEFYASTQTTELDISTQTTEFDPTIQTTEFDPTTQTTEFDATPQTTELDATAQTTEFDPTTKTTEFDATSQTTEFDPTPQTTEFDATPQTTEVDASTLPTTGESSMTSDSLPEVTTLPPTTDGESSSLPTESSQPPTTEQDWVSTTQETSDETSFTSVTNVSSSTVTPTLRYSTLPPATTEKPEYFFKTTVGYVTAGAIGLVCLAGLGALIGGLLWKRHTLNVARSPAANHF